MIKAGMPSQCACHELVILPRNNHEMAWPIPQPGHQVIPIALNGQRLKCADPAGSLKASAMRAATQNVNSKYLKKNRLTNLLAFGRQQ